MVGVERSRPAITLAALPLAMVVAMFLQFRIRTSTAVSMPDTIELFPILQWAVLAGWGMLPFMLWA